MLVPTVVVGLGLLAAALHGCSSPDSGGLSTTTTVPSPAPSASSTTTTPANVPEPAAVPGEPPARHARLRDRRPRAPRVTRQTLRAHLAQTLAARRPDRPLSPTDLDQLANKAMQIRVVRARIARMRPTALETPRAAAMRARLDLLIKEFQTRAGVMVADVPGILEPPPPPPRRGE